jgi:hypothetical protein
VTPQTSITFGPSLLKIFGSVTLASIGITVGVAVLVLLVALLTTDEVLSYAWVIAVGTAVLVGGFYGIAVAGAVFFGRPRIEIGLDGFVDHGIAARRSRRWSDIKGDFAVIRVGLQLVVAYRLTDDFKEILRLKPIPSLAGYDEAILICGDLAIGAAELAEVLNQWKDDMSSETPSA